MSDSIHLNSSENTNPDVDSVKTNNQQDVTTASPPSNVQQNFLADLTDGRQPGHWQTRYEDIEAQGAIKYEKDYLLTLIILNVVVSFCLGEFFQFHQDICPTARKYFFAFLGGSMGGCVFSVKWLIHSVAKNTWNRDRRLWRIFTPIVSGVLGFIVILLMQTEVISIGKLDSTHISKCYAIAFLIGYFSDNAIGKLTEIAQVFFGSSNRK